jgi:hypothetical protein
MGFVENADNVTRSWRHRWTAKVRRSAAYLLIVEALSLGTKRARTLQRAVLRGAVDEV